MDLAIPRDVELPPDLRARVELHDLDDVQEFVRDQQRRREESIPRAEEIIERKLDEFDYWYRHVLQEPIYNGRSHTAESIRQEEVAALQPMLPPELQIKLDQITRRLVDRILRVTSRTTARQSE